MIYADAAALDAARSGFAAGLATLGRDLNAALAGLSEGAGSRRAALDELLSCLSGRRRPGAAGRLRGVRPRARLAPLRRSGLHRSAGDRWRGDASASASPSAFFHVGTCGRYFKSWISDLDRDRFEVRGLPSLSRHGRGGKRDRGACRLLSRVRRQQGPSVDRGTGHTERRARRARLSGARHGCDVVCAGRRCGSRRGNTRPGGTR